MGTGPVADILPKISTDSFELSVTAGVPVRIAHGFGRQVDGWLCIWKSAAVDFRIQNPAADTSKDLVLIPSATATVRLVLL